MITNKIKSKRKNEKKEILNYTEYTLFSDKIRLKYVLSWAELGSSLRCLGQCCKWISKLLIPFTSKVETWTKQWDHHRFQPLMSRAKSILYWNTKEMNTRVYINIKIKRKKQTNKKKRHRHMQTLITYTQRDFYLFAVFVDILFKKILWKYQFCCIENGGRFI